MSKLPIHRAAAPKIKDKISRGLDSLPLVEIVRPWRGYSVGARIRPPGVLRQVLMQQKIAKLVDDKPAPWKAAPRKKAAARKKVAAPKKAAAKPSSNPAAEKTDD